MLLSNVIADVKKVLYVRKKFHNDRQNKDFRLSFQNEKNKIKILSCDTLKKVDTP